VENMILAGLGSNMTTPQLPTSERLLEESLKSMEERGITVSGRSSWFRSAPVPASDQPWFVNGVAKLVTDLSPWRLLALLHDVEAEYGRVRSVPNASRTLDLDLLAYDDLIVGGTDGLMLPHPRLAERAFVLRPLAQLAPEWRHPVSGLTAGEMLAGLPPGQRVERLD
jgi:2-amino-4-hydroxy-6-hydroxymethyldihydropteridine diphosphokinase